MTNFCTATSRYLSYMVRMGYRLTIPPECPPTRIRAISPASSGYPPTRFVGHLEYPPTRLEHSQYVEDASGYSAFTLAINFKNERRRSIPPPGSSILKKSRLGSPAERPVLSSCRPIPGQGPNPNPNQSHKMSGLGGVRLIQGSMRGLSVTARVARKAEESGMALCPCFQVPSLPHPPSSASNPPPFAPHNQLHQPSHPNLKPSQRLKNLPRRSKPSPPN